MLNAYFIAYNEWIRAGLLIYLFVCAVFDHRRKSVPLYVLGIGALLWLVAFATTEGLQMLTSLTGLLPGVFLVLISFLTRGKVGLADGIVIGVTGLFTGLFLNMTILLISLCIFVFYGLFKRIIKNAKSKESMAFIPAVFLSFVGILVF